MNAKEKAEELIEKMLYQIKYNCQPSISIMVAKQCALIAVENEYNALREQLFNLRSYKVIENEKVYLIRLQQLIDEEKEVKQELEKL